MENHISIIICILFVWTYNQITVGQLEDDFQVMDEWTSNLISNEIDDNGSGEELVPFLNPAGGEAFDESFSDHVGNSDYGEYQSKNESKIEESKLNDTDKKQEMNTTESSDNENEESSNTTETDKENLYIMESWLEFGENNNQDEHNEEKENTDDVDREILSQNKDQFGEEVHSAGFGMGILKEMDKLPGDIRDSVMELPKNIRNSVAELPDHIRNSVSELPKSIRHSVGSAWNGIKEVPKKIINIPKNLPSFLNRAPEATTQTSNSRRKTGFFGFGK